jgi:hypothetical protein
MFTNVDFALRSTSQEFAETVKLLLRKVSDSDVTETDV